MHLQGANLNFRIADLHVSQSQEEKHEASGALGERALRGSGSFTAHECLSAGGPCVPAGPDIHLLSQARRAVTDDWVCVLCQSRNNP